MSKKVLILHYCDVYNIEPSETDPVGGASRFATVVKGYAEENPIIVFSGDSLSPSVLSTVTDGEHMVPILNAVGTHIACLGNHDLDFGIDMFEEYKAKWTFPWLVANIFDKPTGDILCDLKPTHMLERNGVKIGFMGLVEDQWIETLGDVDPEEVDYRDFVEMGKELAQKLLADGAELIVAITHMLRANDRLLLQKVPEIDIVCGGHDHDYSSEYVEPHGQVLVKSGTEFRYVSKVDVNIDSTGEKKCTFECLPVTNDIQEDPEVKEIVDKYVELMGGDKLNEVLGYTAVELDMRNTTVRTQESCFGNYVTDIVRHSSKAEICLLNGGSLRSDRIYHRGPLTRQDITSILAFTTPTVVLEMTGELLLEALENSVSGVDALDGRFLQVSGMKFSFDASQAAGSRIVKESVFIEERGEALQLDGTYKVSIGEYLAEGKDGYTMLPQAKVIKDSEICPVLPPRVYLNLSFLRKASDFTKCNLVPKWAKRAAERMKMFLDNHPHAKHSWKPISPVQYEEEFQAWALAPVVEGRITRI